MTKQILVPLDRTFEADAIVPVVADLARGAGATVRLLHVAPAATTVVDADGRVIAFVDQEVARLEGEGLDYLRTVEARLEGSPATSVVRFGSPVDEIVAEAEAFGADLIAMSARCSRHLGRFTFGSIADAVARRARAPVLLLHPGATHAA